MKKSDIDLSLPQRQSALAIILAFGITMGRLISSLWIFLVLIFLDAKNRNLLLYFGAFAAIMIIVAIFAVLWYYRYTYRITATDLIIEKGILNRSKTSIPFERIQNVNFTQNILHQFLNITGLKVETAGSAKAEASILALPLPLAAIIRDQLLSKSKAHKSDSNLLETEEIIPEVELIKLDLFMLFRIGLSANHLGSAILLFFLGLGFAERIGEVLGFDIYNSLADLIVSISMGVIFVVLPFVLVASVIYSIVRIFIKYYDLKVVKKRNTIIVSHGLTKKREKTLFTSKIQILTWKTNFVRRKMGFGVIDFSQASSDENGSKDMITIPGCSINQRDELLQILKLNLEFDRGTTFNKVSIMYFIRNLIIKGFFILIGATALLKIFVEWNMIFILLPFIILAWFLFMRASYRNLGYYFNDDVLVKKSGVYDISFEQIQWHKIQSVNFKTTPFLRRRNLITIVLSTAGGSIDLPFLPKDVADNIINTALYKVESSNKKWM